MSDLNALVERIEGGQELCREVRQPGPGQFRGEGDWRPFTGADEEWEWLVQTGYLPTRALASRPADQEQPS